MWEDLMDEEFRRKLAAQAIGSGVAGGVAAPDEWAQYRGHGRGAPASDAPSPFNLRPAISFDAAIPPPPPPPTGGVPGSGIVKSADGTRELLPNALIPEGAGRMAMNAMSQFMPPPIRTEGAAYRDNQGLWDSMQTTQREDAWKAADPQRRMMEWQNAMQARSLQDRMATQHGYEMEKLNTTIAGDMEKTKLALEGRLPPGEKERLDLNRKLLMSPATSDALAAQAEQALMTGRVSPDEIKTLKQARLEAKFGPQAGEGGKVIAPDFQASLDTLAKRAYDPQEYSTVLQQMKQSGKPWTLKDLDELIFTRMAESNLGQFSSPGGVDYTMDLAARNKQQLPFANKGGENKFISAMMALTGQSPLAMQGVVELDKRMDPSHYELQRKRIEAYARMADLMRAQP